MAYLFLALAFTLNAVANILLKIGSQSGLALEGSLPILIAKNWALLLGCAIFAVNVLFYFLALRSLPVSVAYPIMVVMSFILINGYALFVLGEHITPLQLVGYGAIVLGLLLIVGNAQ